MLVHVLATSLSIAPSTLHPIVATGRSHTPVLCAIQRESELSEAACLSVCWATLGTLAVAATATRSCVGPPLAVGRSILAGGIAAALGEAMFYPLEVAKMRLQQTGMNRLGLMGELRAILVAESGRSMLLTWASTPGVVAGVLRAVVYHGLRLGLFPPIQHALIALLAGGGTGGVSLGVKILIGAVCGAVAAALTTPLDLVKTRLAVRPDAYPNSIGALVGIARDGARAATRSGATRGTSSSAGTSSTVGTPFAAAKWASALWPRGAMAATIVRAALGSGAQLASYDQAKRSLTALLSSCPGGSAMAITLATVVSAAAYVTASAPADLVKTRLMIHKPNNGSAAGATLYAGPLDCLRRSIDDEGLAVLFRGWGASFTRLLPVLLLVMPILERLRALFGVGGF